MYLELSWTFIASFVVSMTNYGQHIPKQNDKFRSRAAQATVVEPKLAPRAQTHEFKIRS